jgi:hypothetical protein
MSLYSSVRWQREKNKIKEVKAVRKSTLASSRVNTHWTLQELMFLRNNWGEKHTYKIAKHLKRSVNAIAMKAVELNLGSSSRGTYSIKDVARITGICRNTVKHVIERFSIVLREAPSHYRNKSKPYRYALDEDDLEKIKSFVVTMGASSLGNKNIARHIWGVAPHPEVCIGCNTNDRLYYAKGMCRNCYRVRRYWDVEKGNRHGSSKNKKNEDWGTRKVGSRKLHG